MTNAIVVHSSESDLMMPIMDIGTAIERRNQMVEFVSKIMVNGTDFGTIPGTGDKPTLFKAGAEKLTTFFGLRKRFSIVEKIEDWDKPFFYYHYRCGLYRGDVLIADGDGSCNSHESKYRYRKASRVCPNCQQSTIIQGKKEYGGGWLCWKKNGGCGSKFKDGDPAIESQPSGRVENEDIADQVNTIQKMAQKRALVAATLLAVNASEYFTQDIEDLVEAIEGEIIETTFDDLPPTPRQAAPKPAAKPQRKATPPSKPSWPTSGPVADFCDEVRKATDHYTSSYHLSNAIGGFGDLSKPEVFAAKLSEAVDRVNVPQSGSEAETAALFDMTEPDAGYTE